MHSSIPKLKFSLAHDALVHFFNNNYWTDDEIDFIRSFCQIHDSDNIWKLKLRLLCEENNDMIVAAVLADSSDDVRSFLCGKYRQNLSFVKLALQLHIHQNALQKWRDKILADIAALLNYKLPSTDIFSRNKVETLIYVLERTIDFHEKYKKADKKFLCRLKMKLSNYQDLLFILKQYWFSTSDKLAYKVIRTKILNPSISTEEFEQICDCSHTSILHYIRDFQIRYEKSF